MPPQQSGHCKREKADDCEQQLKTEHNGAEAELLGPHQRNEKVDDDPRERMPQRHRDETKGDEPQDDDSPVHEQQTGPHRDPCCGRR